MRTCVLTWEDAVEDLQFVRVLPPQAQDVVLPADHLAEDQHDGDGGQANEQEQWVGPLHNIQALLMAHHLESRQGGQNGEKKKHSKGVKLLHFYLQTRKNERKEARLQLSQSDSCFAQQVIPA